MMEGISQEAASIAGNFALSKLIVCYDDNRITIDGTTALSFDAEDHSARLAADGWHIQRVEDSEDLGAITAAISTRPRGTRAPVVHLDSLAHRLSGAARGRHRQGARIATRRAGGACHQGGHGLRPRSPLLGDERVYEHMSLRERGAATRQAWAEQKLAPWRERFPELAADWDRAWRGELRDGWRDALPSFAAGTQIATRSAGQKTMAAFSQYAPSTLGGAADLVESTKTLFEGAGEFSSVHSGRNVPFGIREHAMGAIVNGAAAHGGIVKPYGSTFLIFSDYMRGSVRLSALMGLGVVWVWTHDSIGLGEDGPTHQPVEHYAALRAIPNLWVIRPADANETTQAWRVALEREGGPVALLFSRQTAPVFDRAGDGLADGQRARARRLRAVGRGERAAMSPSWS